MIPVDVKEMQERLAAFWSEAGASPSGRKRRTKVDTVRWGDLELKRYINEFWTSRQRQASSLHEISYRACFKPQLPRFFIEMLTRPGDLVYDPFSGRGTTVVEAALLGRRAAANDVNLLSGVLTKPRLQPPALEKLEERLAEISDKTKGRPGRKTSIDLSMFYHPDTLQEILALRDYLAGRSQKEDRLDRWIRMAATSRLAGHSTGFFSVYTLPPNQAASPESQVRINRRLKQKPEYRDLNSRIVKKTKSLLRNVTPKQLDNLAGAAPSALFLNRPAHQTQELESGSTALVVTSPPFLDVVQYAQDNWLRCWFNKLNANEIARRITSARNIEAWCEVMSAVMAELYRVVRPGGWVAFEVGEVRRQSVELDLYVAPLGLAAGFELAGVLVNHQDFTKTSNIWGVANNRGGTNSNRVVIFRK